MVDESSVRPAVEGRPGTTDDRVSVPWRSRTVLVVLASALMTPMDVALLGPALPAVGSAFGVGGARAGLLVTAYALPAIVVAPFVGRLADRVGRRRVLAGCLVTFGLAGSAIALAVDFRQVLALRALQGVAAGTIVSALAMTLVGDRFEGPRRNAVMGVTAATLSVGAAIYPFVGGSLSTIRWNLPFVLYVVPVLVGGLVFVVLDDPTTDADGRSAGDDADDPTLRATLRTIPTRRALQLYGALVVTYTLSFGAVFTLVPLYLDRTFAVAPDRIGLVTSLTLLGTAVVATGNGRLVDRVRPRTLVATGYGGVALGLAGVGVGTRLATVVPALVTVGLGIGLVTPTLYAGISRLAPERYRASTMTIQTSMVGTGQALGPVLFTTLAAVVGPGPTFVAGSAVASLGALVVLARFRIE